MIYNRNAVEMMGRIGAQVIEEDDTTKLVRVLNRFNIYINKEDKSVGPHLEKDGFWESWITTWVFNNVKEDSVFIDVGANTGYYGFLADSLGAMVAFVEPNPVYYNMIRSSVLNLGLEDKCIVMPIAFSDTSGEAVLNIPAELHGSASLNDIGAKWNVRQEIIKTKRLDDMFGNKHVKGKQYILKIDAEGAEEKIWDGAQNYLASAKPIVVLEYTPGAYGRDFLSKLESYGKLRYIDTAGDEQPVTKNQIIAQTDWAMLVVRP